MFATLGTNGDNPKEAFAIDICAETLGAPNYPLLLLKVSWHLKTTWPFVLASWMIVKQACRA